MIEFVWPLTRGEWLAWSSAFFLVLYGLWLVIAPGRHFVQDGNVSEFRSAIGGGCVGLGIAVMILHPQPLLYLALGSSFLFTAIGRMVSIVLNKGTAISGWISLVITGLLAFFPLSYALGWVR